MYKDQSAIDESGQEKINLALDDMVVVAAIEKDEGWCVVKLIDKGKGWADKTDVIVKLLLKVQDVAAVQFYAVALRMLR